MLWSAILIIIAIWIVCGVLAYGFDFAYWQRHYPSLADRDRKADRFNALMTGCLGPIGLIAIFLQGGHKHGMKFK